MAMGVGIEVFLMPMTLINETTWWDRVKCFFGHHLWWEHVPVDATKGYEEEFEHFPPPPYPPGYKDGWTRDCLHCGKTETCKEDRFR